MTRIQGSTVRHYVTDALGSVMALTDDSGAVKTTYVYDAFGNVTITGETSDNPFQFAGRENDGTGLQLDRNRYYSYELLRYIGEDPIRLRGGDINFYVRVKSNPVNYIDPLGLWTFSIGSVISGGGFGLGGGGGTFFNVGHNPNAGVLYGWSFSITGTAEGGAMAGLGFTPGVNFSLTNACSVQQLTGPFVGGGRGGLGRAGIGYFQSPDGTIRGGGFTIAYPGTAAGYTGASAGASTTSAIIQWLQGQGTSFFVAQ